MIDFGNLEKEKRKRQEMKEAAGPGRAGENPFFKIRHNSSASGQG